MFHLLVPLNSGRWRGYVEGNMVFSEMASVDQIDGDDLFMYPRVSSDISTTSNSFVNCGTPMNLNCPCVAIVSLVSILWNGKRQPQVCVERGPKSNMDDVDAYELMSIGLGCNEAW